MKILFAGGGSLGPVTPLLAVAEAWRQKDPAVKFFWVGTPQGPEHTVVERAGIPFRSLPVARFTRYPSMEWVWLPWRFFSALVAAWRLLREVHPSLVASAGGYTAVPIIFVAKFLRIPCWVHQQDVEVILSNRLTAPFADLVTAAWDASLPHLPAGSMRLGNPVRPSVLGEDRRHAHERLGLDAPRPTVLVLGGGGGSAWINQAVETLEARLLETTNLIHVVGSSQTHARRETRDRHHLVAKLLTDEMPAALAAADVVLCRAGMGTITELAALSKAAIVVPLPKSPQEANARELERRGAAIVLQQETSSGEDIFGKLTALLQDEERRRELGERVRELLPTRIAHDLVERLEKLVEK